MDKKKSLQAIFLFWLLIAGGFIATKELILGTGTEVFLKTAPVDPNDLFRGEYVDLSYEISSLDMESLGASPGYLAIGDTIYVSLDIDKKKVGRASHIGKTAPTGSAFLKGTVKSMSGGTLVASYGIESYFVPQGQGRRIESLRSDLSAKISVGRDGSAVLKSLYANGQEIRFD